VLEQLTEPVKKRQIVRWHRGPGEYADSQEGGSTPAILTHRRELPAQGRSFRKYPNRGTLFGGVPVCQRVQL
jgi:hypothetical protein